MVTDSPVASAIGPGGEVWVFAVGTDQRIHHNQLNGEQWAGWTPFPGTSKTKCAVAATVTLTGGDVQVVHTGLNGKLYLSWLNGESWQPWELLDDGTASTTRTIAVAAAQHTISRTFTGNNNQIYNDTRT
ncbi:hypothetical protein [Streptomyces sp. AC154]|uniref:hypothetical protein n=1 Tax=Streptomyces sp. AC154 TaxID=3143184 RepID=UPI003F818868